MNPVILFRSEYNLEEEKNIAKQYLPLVESRIDLKDSLVIGRYSVLPYYQELERDLLQQGSKLINSHQEHLYIANFEYYFDLEQYTPTSWFRLEDIRDKQGPFILKGVTNSRKHEWNKFFAKDFDEAVKVYCELKNDSLIGNQDIVIRRFEKLKSYGTSLSGIPFANEWRFFFYKEHLLSYGFYWTGLENRPQKKDIDSEAIKLARKVAMVAKDKVNFFVVDVAQKENGEWILIELNDGQQSGLSDNDPKELYSNLNMYLNDDDWDD